ncbi:hypothetical protein FKP32DRAFT_937475 [Trametes sanguinea]|nr:hypothetical protein FKP32DRAFT_937475 [Trametes sanguinea]
MSASRIPNIPFDLIVEITAWLDLEDLSRLSRTCKAFHEWLAPQLFLRPAYIRFGQQNSFIQSLSAGVEGNSGSRVHLLRSLVVEKYLTRNAPILVELLGRASSLVDLKIAHVSTTLTFAQLRTTLANLPALRELSLGYLPDSYLTVLAEVSLLCAESSFAGTL